MGFASCIHEAGHAVIGLHLGFTMEKVEASPARTLWKLGNESDSTPEPTTTGESRSALVDAARSDERALDRLIDGVRVAVGSSDQRVLDYLTMSMAGRIAQARVIPEEDARAGGASDIAVEDLLLCSFGDARRLVNFESRARRKAMNLVDQHWPMIVTVALELHARGRLDHNEVRAVLERERDREPEQVRAGSGVV